MPGLQVTPQGNLSTLQVIPRGPSEGGAVQRMTLSLMLGSG